MQCAEQHRGEAKLRDFLSYSLRADDMEIGVGTLVNTQAITAKFAPAAALAGHHAHSYINTVRVLRSVRLCAIARRTGLYKR